MPFERTMRPAVRDPVDRATVSYMYKDLSLEQRSTGRRQKSRAADRSVQHRSAGSANDARPGRSRRTDRAALVVYGMMMSTPVPAVAGVVAASAIRSSKRGAASAGSGCHGAA